MNRISRRLFSAEFKAEAIKLVNEQGLTLAEVARRLAIAKMECDILKKSARCSLQKSRSEIHQRRPTP